MYLQGDNLKQFFDETSNIRFSQAVWIGLLLLPTLALCLIRELRTLAPLAMIGNLVYIAAIGIIVGYLIVNLQPVESVQAVGLLSDLPLFFVIRVEYESSMSIFYSGRLHLRV